MEPTAKTIIETFLSASLAKLGISRSDRERELVERDQWRIFGGVFEENSALISHVNYEIGVGKGIVDETLLKFINSPAVSRQFGVGISNNWIVPLPSVKRECFVFKDKINDTSFIFISEMEIIFGALISALAMQIYDQIECLDTVDLTQNLDFTRPNKNTKIDAEVLDSVRIPFLKNIGLQQKTIARNFVVLIEQLRSFWRCTFSTLFIVHDNLKISTHERVKIWFESHGLLQSSNLKSLVPQLKNFTRGYVSAPLTHELKHISDDKFYTFSGVTKPVDERELNAEYGFLESILKDARVTGVHSYSEEYLLGALSFFGMHSFIQDMRLFQADDPSAYGKDVLNGYISERGRAHFDAMFWFARLSPSSDREKTLSRALSFYLVWFLGVTTLSQFEDEVSFLRKLPDVSHLQEFYI